MAAARQRRLRTARPVASARPSSNCPTPPGPCSSSACARRASALRQRRGQPGQQRRSSLTAPARVRSGRRQRPCALTRRACATLRRTTCAQRRRACARRCARSAAARRRSAAHSRHARARRRPRPGARSGRAPRRGAPLRRPAAGASSNHSVRSGWRPCCTQASSCASTAAVEAAAAALVGEGRVGEAVAQHRGAGAPAPARSRCCRWSRRAAKTSNASVSASIGSCSTSSRSALGQRRAAGLARHQHRPGRARAANPPGPRCAWTCRRRRCLRR